MTSGQQSLSWSWPVLGLGIGASQTRFEPTRAAALERIDAVDVSAYARSRNALDGAATALSPSITHGITSLAEVAQRLESKHPLHYRDKIVFELGWRAFFQHVWHHHGRAIFSDMRPTPVWSGSYAQAMPQDVLAAQTGIAAIDHAVRLLYATSYLHNHLRMWLASYVVHIRKVHWRVGADWLYGHLLDGDLASNHLSWQWVAGTFSSKPYLFNAENVARYAPSGFGKAWDCRGTVIDASYERLEQIARHEGDQDAERQLMTLEPAIEPQCSIHPPNELLGHRPPPHLRGKPVELVHAFALSERTAEGKNTVRIGVVTPADRLGWSPRRWQFALQRMVEVTDALVWVDPAAPLPEGLAQGLLSAQSLSMESHLSPQLQMLAVALKALRPITLSQAQTLFPNVDKPCGSFTHFYEQVQKLEPDFAKLFLG